MFDQKSRKPGLFAGFKTFIMRGNVVDLAVGVMVGAAFNTVVNALVKDLMTPFVAAIAGQPDFSQFAFTIHGSKFLYGDFLNGLISFLITAATVYFFIVVPINKLNERFGPKPPQATPEMPTKECPECMSKIPQNARRCAFCTMVQPE